MVACRGKRILEKAREAAENDASEEDFRWSSAAIPEFTLTLRVPNIPGQDTSKMNKMTWQMKIMRKAFHMACDRKQVTQLQDLMAIAKVRNLVAPIWGRQVRPSNVTPLLRARGKITRLHRGR